MQNDPCKIQSSGQFRAVADPEGLNFSEALGNIIDHPLNP